MKKTLSFLAVVGVGLAVSACSASPATEPSSDGEIRIAGVYRNTVDAYVASTICAATDEAEKLGVDYEVFSIATNDNTQLTQTLDAALLTNPQGIIFAPADSTTFSSRIATIMADGIAVTGESPQSPDTVWKNIMSSQDGSEFAGELIDSLADVKGKAVILNGLPSESASWELDRYGAIQEALQESNPNLEWLPDQIDNFDVAKGTQLISGVILANPDLKFIIASSGPGGQAVAAAVEQAGKAGEITVLGFDAVPAEVDALRRGTITALIAQSPGDVARAQVNALVEYIKANPDAGPVPVTGEPVFTPLGFLTKDNIDDPDMAGFIYSDTCQN
ncbi:substrate-binding domain-containing protein [Microbacterium aoyamense]|uniref:Substrate-binding domain-containing protein n=1 Tax=Microbacterium aoyamense TaxID=344166 RepID=A0ABN2PCA5_9MICO|nr:sugar ABC transporter substrate-binding protein [Microbacterium aoyamense]